jgi:hypothetical protein
MIGHSVAAQRLRAQGNSFNSRLLEIGYIAKTDLLRQWHIDFSS